jgi:hypothetical protein
MKPYIMQYSENVKKQSVFSTALDSTTRTFSIESEDNDFVNMSQWTTITKTSEASDEDTICLPFLSIRNSSGTNIDDKCMSTLLTEVSENNDDDYILLSTLVTNVTENQDDDYIF